MTKTCEAFCSTKLSERLFKDGYHGDNVNGLHIPGDEYDIDKYYISLNAPTSLHVGALIVDVNPVIHG